MVDFELRDEQSVDFELKIVDSKLGMVDFEPKRLSLGEGRLT
jgi:hypothetical protein